MNRTVIRAFAPALAAALIAASAAAQSTPAPPDTAHAAAKGRPVNGTAVTGRTVTQVVAGNSLFRAGADGAWLETDPDGAFNFQETGRDDSSVYLADDSRGVKLQIDLVRKQVIYSDANNPPRVLYTITSAIAAGQ